MLGKYLAYRIAVLPIKRLWKQEAAFEVQKWYTGATALTKSPLQRSHGT